MIELLLEYTEEKWKEEEAKIVRVQQMYNEKMGIMETFLNVLSKKANGELKNLMVQFITFVTQQLNEGSSAKSWFSMANHLHYTPYPSWARFSGTYTKSISAPTTY